MISEIWTFINDIEDCSPYFPIGIGSPSQYIGNRKKSFEPAVANEDSPPASYQQLRRELDCFSINWTTRYSLLCNPSLIYMSLCRRDTPECGCGLSLLYSVSVKNCAVCGKLGCLRCIHRRKTLPGHLLAGEKKDKKETVRSYPVCGVCHKDWHL